MTAASRYRITAIAAVLAGCESEPAPSSLQPTEAALAQVESQEHMDRSAVAEVSLEAVVLVDQMRRIAADWHEVDKRFRAATDRLARVRRTANQATSAFAAAKADFEAASASYRQVTRILIFAAASDAVARSICSGTTSTRAFRQRLRDEGRSLDGVDIDHIWPRALGGVDHPLNYQTLDSSLNRSLGADVLEKIARWPLATLQGLAVSAVATLACGN